MQENKEDPYAKGNALMKLGMGITVMGCTGPCLILVILGSIVALVEYVVKFFRGG